MAMTVRLSPEAVKLSYLLHHLLFKMASAYRTCIQISVMPVVSVFTYYRSLVLPILCELPISTFRSDLCVSQVLHNLAHYCLKFVYPIESNLVQSRPHRLCVCIVLLYL